MGRDGVVFYYIYFMTKQQLAHTLLSENDPIVLAAVETLLSKRPRIKSFDLNTLDDDMDSIEAETHVNGLLTIEESKAKLFENR